MNDSIDLRTAFHALTDHDPFPWQERLYGQFLRGVVPVSYNIPTGLGKTAVIPLWLIALAAGTEKNGGPAVPRRLVYVVNRRTVVDQSTSVVEKMRHRLLDPRRGEWAKHQEVLDELRDRLQQLAATADLPLAVSTLRGQLADNGQWRSDPARPAVILGTVDMIGSRLLFGGYGLGFKSRPLHAGFLGQDTLVVHDEAHLEPAFQDLLVAIRREQCNGRTPDICPLTVMELTATSRGQGQSPESDEPSGEEEPRGLTDEEKSPPEVLPDPPTRPVEVVWCRLKAKKGLVLKEVQDEKQVVAGIMDRALAHRQSGGAILIFARTVKAVEDICRGLTTGKNKLPEKSVLQLTGTLRGLERDALVKKPVFQRFLPESSRDQGVELPEDTVYLVCTSAGEVGVDISADHMVCDLSTFESMAQRFGRVNRFGEGDDTRIDVIHPTTFEKKGKVNAIDERRLKTLELLKALEGDASPLVLMTRLDEKAKQDAFAPPPDTLPATDILFDAWALTSIRDKLPGRPPVEPYLHGISGWEQPETRVAWREEVEVVTGELLERYSPDDLLDDYPLKPHELLRDRSDRVFGHLETLVAEPKPNSKLRSEQRRQAVERAAANRKKSAWLVRSGEPVRPIRLGELVSEGKETIHGVTLLLPPRVGGLQDGMLNGAAPHVEDESIAYDVADEWYEDKQRGVRRRVRFWEGDDGFDEKTEGMRLVRRIDLPSTEEDEDVAGPSWHWYARPRSADDAGSRSSLEPVKWGCHTRQVAHNARRIAQALRLPEELVHAVTLAAEFHDLGKRRVVWQRSIGNPTPTDWHAKSGKDPETGKRWKPRDICPHYRHEYGSLLDVLDETQEHFTKLKELGDEMQDLVLHLVAAGHGRARPHFEADEVFDLDASLAATATKLSVEVPRRFARLQRKYGRWGLVYLESLLRAADWAASAEPSEFVTKAKEVSP